MKKRIILFAIVSLITTGSIFAKQFTYIINCGNGKEIKGHMSAKDIEEAKEVAKILAEEQC